MADRPPNETKPEKKEFGTGLRAQLERRRDGDAEAPKAPEAQPNVELRFELTARPHDLEAVESADLEPLRAEFQGELEDRERRLREQRTAIEDEHRRIAEIQAEVAAEQALSEDRRQQAE